MQYREKKIFFYLSLLEIYAGKHYRVMPDDPSFCMRLNNIRIHQALALPGAPGAQGATKDESAYLFAETTWKMACAAVSPPVRYEDHVPEYLANGVWRKHPYILQNQANVKPAH